ncbi:hypothetical protein I4U23_015811 [Adineta vaga]|nr:hypothetical protein I4U23_015811 [Adineta vaga]
MDKISRPSVSLTSFGLGWVGLGWVGSGWVGLGWVGLGWVGLGRVGLGWVGLGWVVLGRVGLGWVGSGRVGLGRVGSGWVGLGSDKSGLINIVQSCYKICENLFPEFYLEDGKKSIIYDITGAGLHKELSTGNKFLLMHEADANLTKLGFYQCGQPGTVSNRSLLCEAFDGFSESSKTTGMYEFSIENARLSLLGACTGGSFHLLLARYSSYKISDGCDNRFLYHFVENNLISYDLIKKSDPLLPSIQQIFVIVHLIGKILYTFVDSLGNDESQRFYVTKGKYYIAEGQRLFKERQQPHLQSFYSKSAEIFPRLCVNMQRFLDALLILFEMKKNGDLHFVQVIDQTFITKAKSYIEKYLVFNKNTNGDLTCYVSLETCQITANLFDNYLFKNTLNLFNLDQSINQISIPSTQFRTLVADTPSLEKRILQLPYQFFFRSDLKQPTINENGKKINAPFHHVDGGVLNNTLQKLVDQNLLTIGNFISRPKAQQTHSYMKNSLPDDLFQKEQYCRYLEEYKINVNDYINLLTRSNLPNKCSLLPEAKQLLTSRIEHLNDCMKYNLTSIVNVNIEETSHDVFELNRGNVFNATDENLLIEIPPVVATNNASERRDDLVNMDDGTDALLNKNGVDEDNLLNRNDGVLTRTSEINIAVNSNKNSNIPSDNHREIPDNIYMAPVQQVQTTQFFESNKKTPDVQPKSLDQNHEYMNCQLIQPLYHIESVTDITTSSDTYSEDVQACAKSILQHPSIILSPTDVCLATRHQSAAVRQRTVELMIHEHLLYENTLFVRKLSKSVKMTKGFLKKVPRANDEQSRFRFIVALSRFGITWDTFKSFFDLTKNGFHTTTQLLLNETAEILLDSEDYLPYVIYDKCSIFRPIQSTVIEQEELEYGDNVTDVFYFGGECIYSHRIFFLFSTALLTMRASFHGFVKYFNSLFINKTPFPAKRLDEKNFQINWMVYCLLKLLFQWTDEDVIEIPYSLYEKNEVNAFFDRHKNQLYSSFVKYWSNQTMHKTSSCTISCTDVLIVDGHQKTARTTCKFNNCYDNTIEELGPVLVGCPKSVSNYSQLNSNVLCEKHIKMVSDHGMHIMKFDASDDVTEETCNVKRNESSDNQDRLTTYGFLVSFFPCGIVAGFDESIRSESPRRVLRHLIRIARISKLPLGIIYDTACSIKIYMTARYGTDYFKSTPISDHFYDKESEFTIACKRCAKWIVGCVLTFLALISSPELIFRSIVIDTHDERAWCVLTLNADRQIILVLYSISNILLFVLPLIINLASSIIIIQKTTASKNQMKKNKTTALNRNKSAQLKLQMNMIKRSISQHKHILIAPIVLSCLAVPRLVLSFIFVCKKLDRQPYISLISYCIPFLPCTAIVFVFILPSEVFRKAMCDFTKSIIPQRIHRLFITS